MQPLISCVNEPQILPFILRRTKEQVLKDLPPKILQDVYVDPSPLQRRLYEDFAQSPASQQIAGAVAGGGVKDGPKAPHVFQVCNQTCEKEVMKGCLKGCVSQTSTEIESYQRSDGLRLI